MVASLKEILRALPPSGPHGFEGLVAALLGKLTGFHFSLAKSGSQQGRDMSSRIPNGNTVAVECKRYGQDTELDERQLLGEMVQATRAIPDLDLWVLVTSRDVPSQLLESLTLQAAEKGIGFLALSSDDSDPSSLDALCASFPAIITSHIGVQALDDQARIGNLLSELAQRADCSQKLISLREYFSSPLAGYDNWRRRQNESFLHSLTSAKEARASYGQRINVEEQGVMLLPRRSVWTGITTWYEGWARTHSFLAVLGEAGSGKTWAVASWLSGQIRNKNHFPSTLFLSSADIFDRDSITELRSLFAEQISKDLKVTKEQASRRLDRWLTRTASIVPLFVLVLDGINECGTPERWKRLLERLAGSPWCEKVAVIMTCRTSYWQRHFEKLDFLSITSVTTEPYDHHENGHQACA